MDAVTDLLKINYAYVIISVLSVIAGLKVIISSCEWLIGKLGLETKWMNRKREERELLFNTSKRLSELQQQHISDMESSNRRDDEIYQDIQRLTSMFINKEIDDLRWKILDFSSALANGRQYNRESFDHIEKIYHKYEMLLKENEMENGFVTQSMKFIRKKCQEYLYDGGM